MGNCLKNRERTLIENCIHNKLYFYDKPNILNIQYSTINGIINGEYLVFDKKEKLISKSFYKNGILCGVKTDYNIFIFLNGEMVKVTKYEQIYENGVEISTNIIL